jgi:uncharacterized protein YrrD
MLTELMNAIGFRIEATDGAIGEVDDFYFDEETWTIRYLIADTGRWLPGKRVLIAPEAFDELNWAIERFPVNLTQDQVRNSPDIAEDLPVSRQWETDLHTYYGWTPYWDLYPVGHEPIPLVPPAPEPERPAVSSTREHGDPHLRSMREVRGYEIATSDGRAGQVEDFVAGTDSWKILYLRIDTGGWLSDRTVLLPVDLINQVNWSSRHVVVDLQRQRIEDGPVLDPDAPINRDYETKLYEHLGRTPYWLA